MIFEFEQTLEEYIAAARKRRWNILHRNAEGKKADRLRSIASWGWLGSLVVMFASSIVMAVGKSSFWLALWGVLPGFLLASFAWTALGNGAAAATKRWRERFNGEKAKVTLSADGAIFENRIERIGLPWKAATLAGDDDYLVISNAGQSMDPIPARLVSAEQRQQILAWLEAANAK